VEQGTAGLGAGLRIRLGPGQPGLLQLLGDRNVVRPVVAGDVSVTGQRRHAGPDAARIEPDPVVVETDIVRDRRLQHRVDQAGPARTTRVDEHYALVVGGRGLV